MATAAEPTAGLAEAEGAGPVMRFAPSPNGELHLGHALSALTCWDWARRLGGRFLLRIEDIDTARTREGFVDAIERDLAWLGISWPQPVLRQSRRFPAYAAATARLQALGVLYPCFATRAQIQAAASPGAHDPDGAPIYPGLTQVIPAAEADRRKASGEPHVLRLDMQRAMQLARQRRDGAPLLFTALDAAGVAREVEARPERWGDAVIVRKDTPASYHLAVVVDDAYQGITHVVRGLDLLAATDLHRLLQVLLGLPAPRYHHHRLITDVAGRKLSKSARDTSLASLRDAGATLSDVRAMLDL